MCDIIRNPETSIPSSRALPMCWIAMSASVACVATRTERTPRPCAFSSSAIVPMPGSSSVVRTAFSITSAAASIHSQSVLLPAP
jgi:hypothetical protein